jgi:hypothetical protein
MNRAKGATEMGGFEMAYWRRRIEINALLFPLCGVALAVGLLSRARPVMAQTPQLTRFYNQAANAGITPQENVRIVNSSSTSLCAMIYVFDDAGLLGELCGCPLSASKEVGIPLGSGLTATPAPVDANLTSGDITIFSALPNNGTSGFARGGCDPATSFTPQPGLAAWMEYVTTIPNESNDPFISVPFDQALLNVIVQAGGLYASELGNTGDGSCSCGNDSASGS